MSDPERIAAAVARPLHWLSVLGVPLVRLLSHSTELVLRCLKIRPSDGPPVTEEEVKILMKEGAQAGVFEPVEHGMVRRVFRLGDRRAVNLTTRASEVVWLDIHDPPGEIRRKMIESPHSRFPVCEGTLDNVLGIVRAKDLLGRGFAGDPSPIRGILKVPQLLYEGMPGPKVLEMFRTSATHMGVVINEFGSVVGVLTANDILQPIVGDLATEEPAFDPPARRRDDGSWLLDGMLPIDEFKEVLEVGDLPEGDDETLAGLVLLRIGRIPAVADSFRWGGLRFEVVDMDGHRVDKVLVVPVPARERDAEP